MSHSLDFSQVDVFATASLTGNPVAVVHSAAQLADEEMAAFAHWTNLSETTFLLPPTDARADYRVRIFTPAVELPFAGHPTLGTAHAWLEAGGRPAMPHTVTQECALGLIEVRRGSTPDSPLSFKAPGLLRSGPVDEVTLARVLAGLQLDADRVLRSNWIDNGPGWLGLHLANAQDVLDLRPDFAALRGLKIGVIGAHDTQTAAQIGAGYETRAFCPDLAFPEDPVTGSLNAGFAVWLVRAGHLPGNFVVRQGTVVGRDGRVTVSSDAGELWVGGSCRTLVRGTLRL